MKRLLIFLFCLVVLSGSSGLLCQDTKLPNESEKVLRGDPGFITINELQYGIGLGNTDVPYSKSFFGFTTVNGYQINENFIAAAGTGLSFYNGGLLVPLFLDFRYAFQIGQVTPYVFTDGGLLLNFSDLNSLKLFLNPGIGVRYSFSQNFAANLGSGLLIQAGAGNKDTFINIKAGVTYKF